MSFWGRQTAAKHALRGDPSAGASPTAAWTHPPSALLARVSLWPWQPQAGPVSPPGPTAGRSRQGLSRCPSGRAPCLSSTYSVIYLVNICLLTVYHPPGLSIIYLSSCGLLVFIKRNSWTVCPLLGNFRQTTAVFFLYSVSLLSRRTRIACIRFFFFFEKKVSFYFPFPRNSIFEPLSCISTSPKRGCCLHPSRLCVVSPGHQIPLSPTNHSARKSQIGIMNGTKSTFFGCKTNQVMTP